MNWRYLYIGSVVVLSYVLFLAWNAEKEIKQVFLKDFLKLFGYTLGGSKKKKLTCKVSKESNL